MTDMRHDFADRLDFLDYVRDQFPDATDPYAATGALRGGRDAAAAALAMVDAPDYARTRNFLGGAVTRLSPYLRHGVLSLAEVRDAVMRRVSHREQAGKLVNELAWHDYYQRLYAEIGDGIWQDREEPKTNLAPRAYADTLPNDVCDGTTGLVCMDSISRDLRTGGYLHNHQRMWMAAYLVHWRRVKWQAGARWFLQHLLDGDPASNNLSWQWVASTFAAKPYLFNRESLERFSHGTYCRVCPHYQRDCPFEGTYEDLAARLFPVAEAMKADDSTSRGDRRKIRTDAALPARAAKKDDRKKRRPRDRRYEE